MSKISRRSILMATSALGATAWLPAAAVAAVAANTTSGDAPHAAPQISYLFFNREELDFIEAAVARLIPADDEWPGALEAGVPNYMDKQLAGAWGAGERLYRSGPWSPGTPSQGYQLPFTPAELFHAALAAINKQLAESGTPFAKLSAHQQDAYLKQLEGEGKDLGGVPCAVFFADLWELTLEGFFSDPVYGGNRDMVSWRMIGFPGAYASYYDLIDQHGIKLDRMPMSLAESANGHIHTDPNIPAYLPGQNN